MSKREEIVSAIGDMCLSLPEEQKLLKEERIYEILEAYEQLLGHLDGLFSICRVKRFHLTPEMTQQAIIHKNQAVSLWRALGLSVSVKLHIIEDHLIDMLVALQGFGDLTEDEGERGHQIGALHEYRSRNMKDVATKARAHSRWEQMDKNEGVKKRKLEIQETVKRKRSLNVKEENSKKKRKERSEKRGSLL
jgi:hypothetical protein